MTTLPLPSVFVRLSGLMAAGRQVLFRHCVRYGQMDALVLLASTRLRSFDVRMQSLVARWRAGKLVTHTQRKPASKSPTPEMPADAATEKPLRLPHRFGWLSDRIRPDGFALAATLAEMITDDEMVRLIAEAPQAGRLLRPICRMYGVKADCIALPRRERRKPAPTAAQKERQAEQEEAKRQRELAKTSSKKSVVPKGHTYPVTEREWAIWGRRNKRNERRWRTAKWKRA